MLGSADGAPEAPIRSEIFGLQRFAQHGRSLGETHRATALGSGTTVFFPRLRDNLAVLRLAQHYIGSQAASGHDISPAAEWLLDNFHLVEAQLKAIRDGLPKRYFRALPVLQDPPLAGLPRIYGVAWAFVAHTDAAFDEGLLVHYLLAYQEARELTLGEMWALPTTLRVVLIENLRRLAERVATLKAAREVANLCCDHLAEHPLPDLVALHALMAGRGVGTEFLAQMAHRLQGRRVGDAVDVQAWLQQALPHPAATQAQQIADQAADNLSVSNAIHALRAIGAADWPRIVERSSTLMGLMLHSPMFRAEHTLTRDQTLHGIEALARNSGQREGAVAQVLLSLMQPVSDGNADPFTSVAAHWLQGSGRPVLAARLGLTQDWAWQCRRLARRLALPAYLGALALGTGALLAWALSGVAAPLPWPALAALLMLLPASEAVVAVVNRLISESAQPRHLSRLALGQGIPPEHRVLVAIPAMLTSAAAIRDLSHRLHLHHLANPEPCAQFALLSDWPDAATEHSPADTPALDQACRALQALNQHYPVAPGDAPRFILLHRPRRYSNSEQAWIGWERKRGKLELLVAALAGLAPAAGSAGAAPPPGFIDLGELSRLAGPTPYLLTLDSDTELPPGRLRELVAIAAHPQNRPQLDAGGRRVVHGYGIVQPRMATPLPSHAEQTPFHWLFAGQCGIDPYSAASSEVYQDLFGEGSFSGKGLLQVQAVHAVLGQRLPDGQVLSHDLLEGSLARCAVATDVTVIEDAPSHADVAAARLHRWTRGDWQLLPFLLQWRRYPLRAINRWKMFDNLRRSLVAPAGLALLVLTLVSPGAAALISPWLALALVAAGFTAGPLLGAVAGLAPSRDDIALGRFYRHALRDLGRALLLGGWHLAQLLQLALMYGDAVLRALYRQAVSRRHLLQWTTAAAAAAAAQTRLPALLRRHRAVPVVAATLALLLALAGRLGPAGAALLAWWSASAVWTWLASRPERSGSDRSLSAPDRAWLLGLARDTWRYFERHVGADDNHLPPDNVQHVPHTMVAHRTSPTNIGMYMLAAASAQALGFIGRADLVQRLGLTLDTLERLPRHLGHFYNWYETRTLAVLPPAYVSTVDSGNCSVHLLAVAQACADLAATTLGSVGPTPRPAVLVASAQRLQPLQMVLQGTASLHVLSELCAPDGPWPVDHASAQTLATQLHQGRQALDALRMGPVDHLDTGHSNSLWQLHDHLAMLDSACADLLITHQALAASLQQAGQRCRRLALAPDFAALYDPQRRLLHIGLRADSGQLDDNHYDLLASEARLTSLLAIAKGDVPVRHWAALGRPFFALGHEVGLKSWSGSMFEYLMPSLVLDEPVGSVLHQVTRSAVAVHQQEGHDAGTPWGISESAVAVQDHTLAYQYGPQGVSRLALRRAPADERVVAPYASVMALMVSPVAALANLRALQGLAARQAFGFVESIDYTPQRQRDGQSHTLVHTFMAHHQGMSLVALADLLCHGQPRRWAMADPLLRAVAPLLHERAPREVPVLRDAPPAPPEPTQLNRRMLHLSTPLEEAVAPTQLLGNGRMAVWLRSHGGGSSQWSGLGLTRWRDDALRDDCGSWLYLRRGGEQTAGQRWCSLTAHPAPDPAATYRSQFHPDSVVLEAEWPDLHSRCQVWVSPEDDIELRQVTLSNRSRHPLPLMLASFAEITLAAPKADESHPAFSNLFVQASWQADEQAVYLRRRPRLVGEPAVCAVHFLAPDEHALQAVGACADRALVLGRHGSPAHPLGPFLQGGAAAVPTTQADTDDGQPLPGVPLATGLDPAVSIAVRLCLAPGASVTLSFCTAASESIGHLPALVDKYRQRSHRDRSASMAHTMAGIALRELPFDAQGWAALLLLNTWLTSQLHRRPAMSAPDTDTPTAVDRRALWQHGISGDRPIVLVTIHREQGLGLVQALERALTAWRLGGLAVDLVVVNAEPASYLSPVQHHLQALREHGQRDQGSAAGGPVGALYVINQNPLEATLACTLQRLARVHLLADGRPLAQQMAALAAPHAQSFALRQSLPRLPVRPVLGTPASGQTARAPDFAFDPDNGSLRFAVDGQHQPSRPWVNLLANPNFGCVISEMGPAFCWARNSRLHQITAWSNDPLRDTPSEWLLLHDLAHKRVWPLGRALQDAGPREVEHGIGFTRMRQRIDGLQVTLCWCVDEQSALRQLTVDLEVMDGRPRQLRLVALAEWTLGGSRAERATVDTAFWPPTAEQATPALSATQTEAQAGFGGSTAVLAWRPEQPGDSLVQAAVGARQAGAGVGPGPAASTPDWTCDRREFHDSSGALVLPANLGQRQGAGLDACAALGLTLALPAEGARRCTLLLGHGPDLAAAQALLQQAWPLDPAQRLAGQRDRLDNLLGTVQVSTPDPAFDALVNHWLPYQTLVCRLWARAGFYQAGGAFGFRDQLQDAMSLVQHAPELLAQQILHHAAHQFPEGDVQHWWHEPGGAGVRTHFSDDLLWLPLAAALYVDRTGDVALLARPVPFLQGSVVPEGAEDVYETPSVSAEQASLYEHCARAVDARLRTGVHGLPLFGSGDWNDGMNRVGHEGRGESVWLAWMLCQVVEQMTPLAQAQGETQRAGRWQTAMQGWRSALEQHGWDGRWYRRGFFDDGSVLGSAANAECRIDLVAQAWAVLTGAGDPGRARQAMHSTRTLLQDDEHQLTRLLDPPLQMARPSAGYIQAYPPGVRENGGQYNHAAVWALMAWARLGDGDQAWRLFTMMSPAHRWAHATLGPRYGIEPQAMAGDIYTQAPYAGRGGWSWYTGSAGWLLRAAVESICGLVVARGQVSLSPALPRHWPQVWLTVRHQGRQHHFVVCADEASQRLVQQAHPLARRLQRGEAVGLDSLPDGSVHCLVCQGLASPQDQLGAVMPAR